MGKHWVLCAAVTSANRDAPPVTTAHSSAGVTTDWSPWALWNPKSISFSRVMRCCTLQMQNPVAWRSPALLRRQQCLEAQGVAPVALPGNPLPPPPPNPLPPPPPNPLPPPHRTPSLPPTGRGRSVVGRFGSGCFRSTGRACHGRGGAWWAGWVGTRRAPLTRSPDRTRPGHCQRGGRTGRIGHVLQVRARCCVAQRDGREPPSAAVLLPSLCTTDRRALTSSRNTRVLHRWWRCWCARCWALATWE